jgi:hypothetical protein
MNDGMERAQRLIRVRAQGRTQMRGTAVFLPFFSLLLFFFSFLLSCKRGERAYIFLSFLVYLSFISGDEG